MATDTTKSCHMSRQTLIPGIVCGAVASGGGEAAQSSEIRSAMISLRCPGAGANRPAVVRGGKRSLRARMTAREALSNVILGPEVYVCLTPTLHHYL